MKTKFTLLSLVLLFSSFYLSAQTGTVTDYDGNVYKTIKIGNQWWMAENLRATHYYDGTAIAHSTATMTSSANDYKDYFMYPNNDANNVATYGLLYSWGVTTTKSLLPTGWVLADTTAWAILATYLGGKTVAGGILKSTSSSWSTPNTSATDGYGFNAVPAGDCNTTGFTVFGQQARFWTPQLVDVGGAGRIYMILSYNSAAITKGQYRNVNTISLRFVQNTTTANDIVNSTIQPSLQGSIVKNSLEIKNLQINSQLSIWSLNGTLVKSAVTSSNNQFEWNVNDLSQGVYILSIKANQSSVKLKFIKQ